MKHSALALALFLLPAPLAQAQSVEYEKFVLDNGLVVILHEDHSLPQAAVNLWYRVGSKDELPGRSGFAHLFEHLMFMGTERAPGSAFDDIMEAGGGSNNATTSEDRTNYFESGPAELLPTLLWLEADRLEDLGRTMTQEKLDKQREVVRNERRQTSENTPYGRAELKSTELLYPPGHPYHLPVIGSHEDLQAATVDDVKNFFATYYVPSNASLVVAGAFDSKEIRALIERLFGTLPRGADVVHRSAPPARLERAILHTSTDAVQFARTEILWHSPALFAPGDAELDLLAAILADGVSSRLYQKLVVETGLAVDVDAHQASRLLGSNFSISALVRPGVEPSAVERAIDEVLEVLLREGPTAPEVERQKAKIEHKMLDGLQAITEKADRLNMYEFHFGEPNSFARDLDRYRNANAASVHQVAREVLGVRERLVMRVLPEPVAPESNPRAERPEPGATTAFVPPAPTSSFALANGLRVLFWERRELPLVELLLLLPIGSADDPEGKGGLAALAADMLDEGAGERSAVEFADALDMVGASLSTRVEPEWTRISLSALRRNLQPALELAADALTRPRFDEAEWKRVHDLHLQSLAKAQDDPVRVAERVALKAFYGEGHPYGRPVDGTPASARGIALAEARGFVRSHLSAAGATLLVAGDLSADEAKKLLEANLGKLPARPRVEGRTRSVPPPANQRLRVVLVDRPGAVQTVVRLVMPAPDFGAPERPQRELLALILGGTFTSRLNQNLREDKGYTYGASSRFAFGPSASRLVAATSVRTDVTGASLAEILKEVRALRAGDVREVEAEKARSTARQRAVAACATLSGLLGTAAQRVMHGLELETLEQELALVARTRAEELNRLAPTTVPLESALLLFVGDRAAILPQLEGLGLPAPELVDLEGRPLQRD